MKKPVFSRRAFIKTTLGVIGLGGLAGYGMSTFKAEAFLGATLQRLLGEFKIDDEQMRRFCDDFANGYGHKKLYAIFLLEQAPVLGHIAENLSLHRPRSAVEYFERKLLTEFIISTSYLRVGNPAADAIEYYGMKIPCNNPFARFEFDSLSLAKPG